MDEVYMDKLLEELGCLFSAVNRQKEATQNAIKWALSAIQNTERVEPETQRWIPVSEHLPDDFDEVNITWVNHAPEPYYAHIKDIPFVASGVYYKGRWYWWSAVCAEYLRECGESPNDIMDDSIEVVAWMPLPEPYKESD